MGVTPFDVLRVRVEMSLSSFEASLEGGRGSHDAYCTCPPCVFVRGIRGELAAFEKAEKRAKKPKRREAVPLDPMVDAVVSGRFPPGKRAKK